VLKEINILYKVTNKHSTSPESISTQILIKALMKRKKEKQCVMTAEHHELW